MFVDRYLNLGAAWIWEHTWTQAERQYWLASPPRPAPALPVRAWWAAKLFFLRALVPWLIQMLLMFVVAVGLLWMSVKFLFL